MPTIRIRVVEGDRIANPGTSSSFIPTDDSHSTRLWYIPLVPSDVMSRVIWPTDLTDLLQLNNNGGCNEC